MVEEVLILKVLTLKEFSRQVSDSASVHYNFSFFPDELRNFRDILVTHLNISIFLVQDHFRIVSHFSSTDAIKVNARCSECGRHQNMIAVATKYDFCGNKI